MLLSDRIKMLEFVHGKFPDADEPCDDLRSYQMDYKSKISNGTMDMVKCRFILSGRAVAYQSLLYNEKYINICSDKIIKIFDRDDYFDCTQIAIHDYEKIINDSGINTIVLHKINKFLLDYLFRNKSIMISDKSTIPNGLRRLLIIA